MVCPFLFLSAALLYNLKQPRRHFPHVLVANSGQISGLRAMRV